VRELAGEYGGALDCSADPGGFQVVLSLPAAEQTPVLVIDDNSDTLELFRRYCTGTRYALTGLREPARAAETVLALRPRLVLLDLMMPDVDGWEVLARLRSLPGRSETPIVMLSILPQGALALALGADAFLQKPVSRQDFLNTLDQLAAPPAAG
jgi:CheY-like chemotaxis protein